MARICEVDGCGRESKPHYPLCAKCDVYVPAFHSRELRRLYSEYGEPKRGYLTHLNTARMLVARGKAARAAGTESENRPAHQA